MYFLSKFWVKGTRKVLACLSLSQNRRQNSLTVYPSFNKQIKCPQQTNFKKINVFNIVHRTPQTTKSIITHCLLDQVRFDVSLSWAQNLTAVGETMMAIFCELYNQEVDSKAKFSQLMFQAMDYIFASSISFF